MEKIGKGGEFIHGTGQYQRLRPGENLRYDEVIPKKDIRMLHPKYPLVARLSALPTAGIRIRDD